MRRDGAVANYDSHPETAFLDDRGEEGVSEALLCCLFRTAFATVSERAVKSSAAATESGARQLDSQVCDDFADEGTSSDNPEADPHTPDVSAQNCDKFVTDELGLQQGEPEHSRNIALHTYRREREDDHDPNRDEPCKRSSGQRTGVPETEATSTCQIAPSDTNTVADKQTRQIG